MFALLSSLFFVVLQERNEMSSECRKEGLKFSQEDETKVSPSLSKDKIL